MDWFHPSVEPYLLAPEGAFSPLSSGRRLGMPGRKLLKYSASEDATANKVMKAVVVGLILESYRTMKDPWLRFLWKTVRYHCCC